MRTGAKIWLTALIAALACADHERISSPGGGTAFAIADATINGGSSHFYILPPVRPHVAYDGQFDADANPEVIVCKLNGCVDGAIARFTLNGGTNGQTLSRDLAGELYQVNWDTRMPGVEPGSAYRIAVFMDGAVLGYADVLVIENGAELKNIDTNEYIGLVDGRTLPFKFRVEKGIVVLPPSTTEPVGVAFPENSAGASVALRFAPGAFSEPIAVSADYIELPAGTGTIPGAAVDLGPDGAAFDAPVDITIRFDPQQVPTGIAPETLRLFRREERGWVSLASTYDPLNSTITAQTSHFSEYAVMTAVASHELYIGGELAEYNTGPFIPVVVDDTTEALLRLFDAAGTLLTDRAVNWMTDLGSMASVLSVPLEGDTAWSARAVLIGHGVAEDYMGEVGAIPEGEDPGHTDIWGRIQTRLVFHDLSVGRGSACGIIQSGAAFCWGDNAGGRLGSGSVGGFMMRPVRVEGGLVFDRIDVGDHRACGIVSGNGAYCWGSGLAPAPIAAPVALPGGSALVAVVAGADEPCGLTSAGKAYCWPFLSTTPQEVPGDLSFTALSSSIVSSSSVVYCGVTRSGDLYCWGNSESYALGDGRQSSSPLEPQPVETSGIDNFSGSFASVDGGWAAMCALDSLGQVVCWGEATFGQVATADGCWDEWGFGCQRYPTVVPLGTGHSFALAYSQVCVLQESGAAICWNNNGQWSVDPALQFTKIDGGAILTAASSSSQLLHCGLTVEGSVYCWEYGNPIRVEGT